MRCIYPGPQTRTVYSRFWRGPGCECVFGYLSRNASISTIFQEPDSFVRFVERRRGGPCANWMGSFPFTSTANGRPSSHWSVPVTGTLLVKRQSSQVARRCWLRKSQKGVVESRAMEKVRSEGITWDTRSGSVDLPELGTPTRKQLRGLPVRGRAWDAHQEAITRSTGS